ncbi:hypothetical protein P9E05_01985 [Bacillus mojavensis]|uniref:hypothetical protein n=1 Tax=Bacillus mojavensis TaxID=72360 RepID=UPI002DB705F8|nr:hypothetical protein [Bacillus mojavensis]MEC1690295.1 hypothetical protein [Bacillus mojavensis]
MTEEVKRLRCALAEAIAENERLKTENKMLIGELATIRGMLPDEYGFEEGTVAYAVSHPEGVKDLVKQTLARMQSRVEFNRWLYDEADEYSCELVDLLVKCLPALAESKTDYSELSKEIRAINASFSV